MLCPLTFSAHGAVVDARPPVPPGEREALTARLRRLWDAADAASLGVLDELSLADVVSDRIPRRVRDLIP